MVFFMLRHRPAAWPAGEPPLISAIIHPYQYETGCYSARLKPGSFQPGQVLPHKKINIEFLACYLTAEISVAFCTFMRLKPGMGIFSD